MEVSIMLAKTVCTDRQYEALKKSDRDEILKTAREKVDQVLELQKRGLICTTGKFVPSVHYPPITQYPFHTQEEVMATYKMPEDGLLDIYVHVPFCAQHCSFCCPNTQAWANTEKETAREKPTPFTTCAPDTVCWIPAHSGSAKRRRKYPMGGTPPATACAPGRY